MSPALNSALALLALVLAVLALVLATVANRRWASRPRRALEVSPEAHPAVHATPGPDRSELHALDTALTALRDQVQAVSAHVDDLDSRTEAGPGEIAALRDQVLELSEQAGRTTSDPTALRHVALVRYDAFADVGGRLSYSLALLDDTRSGVVMTTLAGKADVRTYVRPISAGSAEGSLTAEEQQAIDAAVGSDQ